MEKEEQALNMIGLIATRKTELYQNIIEEIPEKEVDRQELATNIAEIDNTAFLTEEEIEEDKINPENNIEDLDLNLEGLIANLGYEEYFQSELD